jgi:membrane-associated phospholipid phosphatase
MLRLKKIDVLFFAFLCITTILILCTWSTSENIRDLLTTRLLLIIGAFAIILMNSRLNSSLFNLIRNVYPVIFSGYFYSETVFYNKVFFNNFDPLLIQLDQAIFGFQPSILFSEYCSHPIFAELMYIGYFSFYLIIIGFIIALYVKKDAHFNENIFKFTAAFFLFYLFFGIFPSEGPQFYFDSPNKDLPVAYLFDSIMHFIQAHAEQPTAAFPSSHVGLSIIILMLSKKSIPKFYKISLPFVVLLILSTVYIKAHYVVDVIGGIIIAPIIVYLTTLLFNFKTKKEKINASHS